MNGLLKSLILSVTTASLFAAIAMAWIRTGALREVVRFAAGLMITISILTPLSRLELTPWRNIFAQDTASVERQITQAQEQYDTYMQQSAADQIRAYIAGRLRDHEVACDVAVDLITEKGGETTSALITLTGTSDDRQTALTIVMDECGIAKENISYVERESP